MALLNHQLTVWEIAHQWNNHDPGRLRLSGIPLQVVDSIQLMMDAILNRRLVAENLFTEKRPPESDIPPEYFGASDRIFLSLGSGFQKAGTAETSRQGIQENGGRARRLRLIRSKGKTTPCRPWRARRPKSGMNRLIG